LLFGICKNNWISRLIRAITQAKESPAETKVQPIEIKQLDTLSRFISSVAAQLRTQQEEIEQIKNLLQENDKTRISLDKVLLYTITFLVLALLLYFFLDKRNRRDEILFILTGRESENGIHRLSIFKNEIIEDAVKKAKQIPLPTPSSKSNNTELELTIKNLQTRIADLEDAGRKKTDEHSRRAEEQSQPVISAPSSKTLYADAIINSVLNKVTEQPNDDTVYELFLKTQTNKNAEVTIYKDAYRRVIETPDFIEGCEKQRISNTPNNLQVEKGEVQLQDNGKWQIIKKVNVKFI